MYSTCTYLIIGLLYAGANHVETVGKYKTDWSYSGEKGSQAWGNIYEKCSGNNQSPINLDSATAYKKTLSGIIFKDYNTINKKNTMVENNGHSVKVFTVIPSAATMSGGPLPDIYEFLQLHFHWGSEHTINGKRFPLEMHIVHKFVGEKAPRKVEDGLSVAGFIFEISEEDNPVLAPLLNTFQIVTQPGEKTKLAQTLSVPDLIAAAAGGGFFIYSGSLTTPTCDEVVLWIVYKTPLKISNTQMNAFLTLKNTENEPLQDNFRPVQPLNGRAVLQTA